MVSAHRLWERRRKVKCPKKALTFRQFSPAPPRLQRSFSRIDCPRKHSPLLLNAKTHTVMECAIRRAARACRSYSFAKQFRVFSSESSSATYRGEIGEVSGVPKEHLKRRVVIYSPARTASQQGSAATGKWKINFNTTDKWENPLMGWTSTGDPYANLGEHPLTFDTKEAAINFVNKYGWDYSIREPHRPIIKSKAYADNFKYRGPPDQETS